MTNGRKDDAGVGLATKVLIAAFALAAAAMLVLIALALIVPRVIDRAVEAYTDTQPALPQLPAVSSEETDAIQARVDEYEKALDAHEAREPLVLTERDLTALLAKSLKDEKDAALGVQLLPGQIRARVSLRLTQTLPLGPWSRDLTGRYLNGVATFEASARAGKLDLHLAAFEVKGRQLPEYVLDVLRGEIDKSGALKDKDVQEFLDKIDSIEIENGQLTITPPQ